MSDLSSFVQGLSSSIDGYLKQKQSNQLNLQQNQDAFNQKQQQDAQVFGQQPDLTPDMAESMIPGSSKWVNAFQQQNGRLPKMSEAKDSLDLISKQLEEAQKNNKPPKKSYIGNDPDGNPILGDTNGNFFDSEGNVYNGKIMPKSSTMPTSQTRSSAEFAASLMPHLDKMDQLIDSADKAGLVGPTRGRIFSDFLAGKVGSTGDPKLDSQLGELRTFDSLIKSGTLKVHFGSRGGQMMYEHFNDMLNSGKQSASAMHGAINGIRGFMRGYMEAGNTGQIQTPVDTTPPPPTNRPSLDSFNK